MVLTWITRVILWLKNAEDPFWVVFIRSLLTLLVNHDKLTDRIGVTRRRIIQVSALSTFDGTVLAYHGDHG